MINKSHKHSVFIVDDDADDRESIFDAFMENKHQQDYIFMKNGEQLMGHLASAPKVRPLLIMLDLNMPGMDGRDVLKELKSNESLSPIPIVVLTTSSSTTDRETSYRLGANCFLTKPDSYQKLLELTDSIAKLWF
jgi:CheY-like chemotaxis protein